jgi:hypothetical protein
MRPTLRGFSHSFHAGVNFRCEGAGSDGTPLRVPLHRSFQLSSRRRMKANPDVRHQLHAASIEFGQSPFNLLLPSGLNIPVNFVLKTFQ